MPGENVPGTWKTLAQRDYLNCATSLISSLKPLTTNSFQVILSKEHAAAKETSLGRTRFVLSKSNLSELNAADIICQLKQAIRRRIGVSVFDSVLRYRASQGSMQGIFNDPLPVVVVNLDKVVPLKEAQVLANKESNIPLQLNSKMLGIAHFLLAVAKKCIREWHPLRKIGKRVEERFSSAWLDCVKWTMSPQYGSEMKGHISNRSPLGCLRKTIDKRFDGDALIVKDKGNEIVLGSATNITRFIDEDRELLTIAPPVKLIKKYRG